MTLITVLPWLKIFDDLNFSNAQFHQSLCYKLVFSTLSESSGHITKLAFSVSRFEFLASSQMRLQAKTMTFSDHWHFWLLFWCHYRSNIQKDQVYWWTLWTPERRYTRFGHLQWLPTVSQCVDLRWVRLDIGHTWRQDSRWVFLEFFCLWWFHKVRTLPFFPF